MADKTLSAYAFFGGKMKDNNKKNSNDEKIHVHNNIFNTIKETNQNRIESEQKKELEIQKQYEQAEKAKKEAKERRLLDEKKELIRLKQGLIEESETIHEEKEEEIQLSFPKKISNFFYHNKWWLIIACVGLCIAIYLMYSLISKPRPDMTVLFLGECPPIGEDSTKLEEYFASFTEDFNENGEVLVSVCYIPYSDNEQKNYVNGVDTKLTAEMQSGNAVIVIGNDKIGKMVNPEDAFMDLNSICPDDPNVNGYYYELSNTDFFQKVGIQPNEIEGEWFISLRKPRTLLYTKQDEMEKTFERDVPVFKKITKDLS